MKKLLITAVLALSLALPMTSVQADSTSWYRVNTPGSWLDIYSKPGYRKGRFRCRLPHNEYVLLSAQGPGIIMEDRQTYYHVYWKKRLGAMEWHFRDGMNGKWCPAWNRHGWVESRYLRPVNFPGGLWIE